MNRPRTTSGAAAIGILAAVFVLAGGAVLRTNAQQSEVQGWRGDGASRDEI